MYNSLAINQSTTPSSGASSLLTNMKPRASSAVISNRRYYYQNSNIESYGHSNGNNNSSNNQTGDNCNYNLPKLFGRSSIDGSPKIITFETTKSIDSSSSAQQPFSAGGSVDASCPTYAVPHSTSQPVTHYLANTIPGAGSSLPRAQSASGYRKNIPISNLFGSSNNAIASTSMGGGYGPVVTGKPPLGSTSGLLHNTRAMLVRPSSGSLSRPTMLSTPPSSASQSTGQLESRNAPPRLQSILKKSNSADHLAGSCMPGQDIYHETTDGKENKKRVIFALPLTSSHPLSNPFEFPSCPPPSKRTEAGSNLHPTGPKSVRILASTAADATVTNFNSKIESNSDCNEIGTPASSQSGTISPTSASPSGSPPSSQVVKSGGFPSSQSINIAPSHRVAAGSMVPSQPVMSASPRSEVVIETVPEPVATSCPATMHIVSPLVSKNTEDDSTTRALFLTVSRDNGISVQIQGGMGGLGSSSSDGDSGSMSCIVPIMRLESFTSDVGDHPIETTSTKADNTHVLKREVTIDNSKSKSSAADDRKPVSASSTVTAPVAVLSTPTDATAIKEKQSSSAIAGTASSYSNTKRKSFRPSLTEQLAQIGAKASAITSEIRAKNPQESFFSSSLNSAIAVGRNANAIYMGGSSSEGGEGGFYSAPPSSSLEVGMLFSMPSKSFSVGSLTCKYPSPALFYPDRLEYVFHHPYESVSISMVLFYRDMQTVNIVGAKLRFKLPRRLALFLGDFDPHNPLHMIVLEVTTASSISSIRDKVLPLIAQCR